MPSELVLAISQQGATGVTRHTFNVPNNAAFRGIALSFQALTGPGGSLELTNPVVPVLH